MYSLPSIPYLAGNATVTEARRWVTMQTVARDAYGFRNPSTNGYAPGPRPPAEVADTSTSVKSVEPPSSGGSWLDFSKACCGPVGGFPAGGFPAPARSAGAACPPSW
ncbi:hypothetical protein ACFFX1_25675 [Dactylosporangium sucinum]|uniref:Uncharacterized protein n=1 Tax=Dactylosporangium sucinum TaxID=1424081 RepID=A0A917T5R5_9ACTN|nr:hypothetical protein [Dactylosporangium sucinum]GGM11384.1 hypothetical protein GCM10007977_010650 [Dactylosporangium sucinum]